MSIYILTGRHGIILVGCLLGDGYCMPGTITGILCGQGKSVTGIFYIFIPMSDLCRAVGPVDWSSQVLTLVSVLYVLYFTKY